MKIAVEINFSCLSCRHSKYTTYKYARRRQKSKPVTIQIILSLLLANGVVSSKAFLVVVHNVERIGVGTRQSSLREWPFDDIPVYKQLVGSSTRNIYYTLRAYDILRILERVSTRWSAVDKDRASNYYPCSSSLGQPNSTDFLLLVM